MSESQTTIEQRWEQHKRDGGKLALEQFAARKPKKRTNNNRKRRRKSDLADVAMDVFDDLPDGAFFAAAQDTFGLDPEDFVR